MFDITKSDYYKIYLAERDEIERLKWIESEKVGYDIGLDRARWIWVTSYRDKWILHARTGFFSDRYT